MIRFVCICGEHFSDLGEFHPHALACRARVTAQQDRERARWREAHNAYRREYYWRDPERARANQNARRQRQRQRESA